MPHHRTTALADTPAPVRLGKALSAALARNFEIARGGAAHNMPVMEGMRGFAVFLVFIVHYVANAAPGIGTEHTLLQHLASAIQTMGNAGVDLFFVLSGYLIYGSLISRPQKFGPFMARRVRRIYPAFLCVFAVYLLLSLAFHGQAKIPASMPESAIYLIENLLLLPGIFPITPLILVTWSLSYEMFYYLTIPLLIMLFGLREKSVAWRLGFFVCLSIVGACLGARYGGPVRLIMFMAGILLFEVFRKTNIPAPSGHLALAALVFGLFAQLLAPIGSGGDALKCAVLFVTLFIFALACFRNPIGMLAHAFCWPPLRWLGNMSYSYYLLHGLVLKIAFIAIAAALPNPHFGPWTFWALLPVMFALTLGPAILLFLAVEQPFSLMSSGSKPLDTSPAFASAAEALD